jgi:hypothetical protein
MVVSFLAASQMLTTTARADFTFDGGGKPAPSAELQKFFSGTSWIWPCKGCGAYFSPDGKYTFVWIEKGEAQVGRGTWSAKDGELCWDAEVAAKSGKKDPSNHCRNALFGPGSDGGSKAKAALGLQKDDKSGYFWVWQDKRIWKEFKKGDKITANAAKIEAQFAKK